MSTAVGSPLLESLYGVPVSAAELRGDGDAGALLPEERLGQERWAAKRVSEFAAGRQCAHLAMRQLGIAPLPLLSQADRRPAWPDGVVGSITHCRSYGAAVVARKTSVRSLGLDAEVSDAVEPHLWSRILTPHEIAWVHFRPEAERRSWATVVFSAKEAFYKCQFNVTGNRLGFSDAEVEIQLPPTEGVFALVMRSKNVTLQGRGLVSEGIVRTAFAWPNLKQETGR